MISRAAIAAEADGAGGTRLRTLSGTGALALRADGSTVYQVGAAAGPLGGDDLELTIEVGRGARLTVRSAAAMIALPGRPANPSRMTVRADVRGTLVYMPEPLIAAAGCHHQAVSEIRLARGATVRWREELVLGRHGEQPGRLVSRIDATLEGRPLLRHSLSIGDGHTSTAVLGGARAVGMSLMAGSHTPAPAVGDGVAVLDLAGPGALACALGEDLPEMRTRLAQAEGHSP